MTEGAVNESNSEPNTSEPAAIEDDRAADKRTWL
jgi:hypothetical protein